MELPAIIVNFKLYESATGDTALKLAKIHEQVANETGASIGIAVNPLDLFRIINEVNIPVFSQHIDPVSYGSFTGHILPDLVKESGAFGTILNHAEFQLGDQVLENSIRRAKEVGLFTIVCANDADMAEKIAQKWEPDLIALEPPDLIGGDVSVSKAEPRIIEDSLARVGQGRLLVGAGVKTGEDVKIACALGASGVLLASGITKSDDPYGALMDLVSGLK